MFDSMGELAAEFVEPLDGRVVRVGDRAMYHHTSYPYQLFAGTVTGIRRLPGGIHVVQITLDGGDVVYPSHSEIHLESAPPRSCRWCGELDRARGLTGKAPE